MFIFHLDPQCSYVVTVCQLHVLLVTNNGQLYNSGLNKWRFICLMEQKVPGYMAQGWYVSSTMPSRPWLFISTILRVVFHLFVFCLMAKRQLLQLWASCLYYRKEEGEPATQQEG